jgi:hypothetical protein
MGSISFGDDFVAGKNLVPSPAAGKTAFLIFFDIPPFLNRFKPFKEKNIIKKELSKYILTL